MKKGIYPKMLMSTIIMAVMAIALVLIGYYKGEHVNGLRQAMIMAIQIVPLLIFAFIIAGMVQVLLPHEAIAKWIGNESGAKGILVGAIAGAFTPGGPYVSLPIVAGLLRSGASMGTTVAYITSWSLLAFSKLPLEVGILGWRFAFIRMMSALMLPFIAGFFAQVVSRIIR
ncbi:permease [Candidatus Omnitrophota bacterium]